MYLDKAGNECGKEDADAQEYRKYTSDETESTITTYETKNATQTDTIGILCGAIGQGGTVDRVFSERRFCVSGSGQERLIRNHNE